MLSQPLARHSAGTHRPSFWHCDHMLWSSIVSVQRNKKYQILLVRTVKVIVILIGLQWSGTFLVSSTWSSEPVFCCFWQLILGWAEGPWLLVWASQKTHKHTMAMKCSATTPGVRAVLGKTRPIHVSTSTRVLWFLHRLQQVEKCGCVLETAKSEFNCIECASSNNIYDKNSTWMRLGKDRQAESNTQKVSKI